MRPSSLPLAEVVPLVAALLSLPLPAERYPPLTLPPQRPEQLEALLTWLLALTEEQPVLFIVEDLHWIDPSTLEFLTLLVDQGQRRLLTLLTCRPEFPPPWGWRTHLTPLALQRLPQAQVEEMIARVTGGRALPPEVVAQIVAKTDGVPLFVEELTKTFLESGLLRETSGHYELTGPLPPLAIPATLQDSLVARLDRLATVKAVAQLGAVLGRTFAYAVLQAVSPLDEVALQQALAQLVEAELLYQRGIHPKRPTCSSMSSSRRPPISRCSRARVSRLTSASHTCWNSNFRRWLPPNPNCWHATSRKRASTSRRCCTGSERATRERPLGVSGSHQPLDHGHRAPQDPARDP